MFDWLFLVSAIVFPFVHRSEVWTIYFWCAQDGLIIDVSRETTLSVEMVQSSTSSVTLADGTSFSGSIVADQSVVMSSRMALGIPLAYPISPDVTEELQPILQAYIAGLSEGTPALNRNTTLGEQLSKHLTG